MKEWYIIFEPPRLGLRTLFGHVRLIGYDIDRYSGTPTWMFYDPALKGATFLLFYRPNDVEVVLSTYFSVGTVLRIGAGRASPPLGLLLTCASIVGHMVGFRAFTPWGLKRQLLRYGATVVRKEGDDDGRRRRPESKGTARTCPADRA